MKILEVRILAVFALALVQHMLLISCNGQRSNWQRDRECNNCKLNGHCSVVGEVFTSFQIFSFDLLLKHASLSGGTSWPGTSSTDSTWTRKVWRTTSVPATGKGERGEDERLTKATTTTTHPKTRIRRIKGQCNTPDADRTKDNEQRKTQDVQTSICSTFFPYLSWVP